MERGKKDFKEHWKNREGLRHPIIITTDTDTAAHGLSLVSKFILPSHWDHRHHSCWSIRNPVRDYDVFSSKNIINKLQQNANCLYIVVFFLSGDPPASELYVLMFLNTVCSTFIGRVNNKACRRFGTLQMFLLQRSCEQEESSCSHNLWRWKRQSVPKRRHIKFRSRGITQKKIPLSQHGESMKWRMCEYYLRIVWGEQNRFDISRKVECKPMGFVQFSNRKEDEYGAVVEWYKQCDNGVIGEKTGPSCTFSTTWADLESNPGFHTEKLKTRCLRYSPIRKTFKKRRYVHRELPSSGILRFGPNYRSRNIANKLPICTA
jgi:hypothetical protein